MPSTKTEIQTKTSTVSVTIAGSLMLATSTVALFLSWGMMAVVIGFVVHPKTVVRLAAVGGGAGAQPACSDGVDNNGNGRVDMDDSFCTDATQNTELILWRIELPGPALLSTPSVAVGEISPQSPGPEIVYTHGEDLFVLSGTGQLLARHHFDHGVGGVPPQLADLDGDGGAEVIFHRLHAEVYGRLLPSDQPPELRWRREWVADLAPAIGDVDRTQPGLELVSVSLGGETHGTISLLGADGSPLWGRQMILSAPLPTEYEFLLYPTGNWEGRILFIAWVARNAEVAWYNGTADTTYTVRCSDAGRCPELFDSGPILPGETFQWDFSVPGLYYYQIDPPPFFPPPPLIEQKAPIMVSVDEDGTHEFPDSFGGEGPSPVLVDLNGDGNLDLLMTSNTFDSAYLYGISGRGEELFRVRGEVGPGCGPKRPDPCLPTTHPAVANIDADGLPEIVIGYGSPGTVPAAVPPDGVHFFPDGRMYVFDVVPGDSVGSVTVATRCYFETGANPIYSSPVLTDLNGDGNIEAVFGTGPLALRGSDPKQNPYPPDNQVVALDVRTCQPTAVFPLINDGTITGPAVADFDGDGKREVVVTTKAGLYLLNYRLEPLRFINTLGSLVGTPTLVDLNGDGTLEIILPVEHPGGGGALVGLTSGLVGVSRGGWPTFRRNLQHTGAEVDRPAAALPFRRGDADANGALDISDPIFILLHLFRGGAEPPCLDAADSDDSGAIDMTDAVRLLLYQFRGEEDKIPPLPGPVDKGPDPTADDIGCKQYP